jgi:hypothetical protein
MSVEFFGDLVDRPNERVRRRQHVGAGEHRNGADNSYKTVNDISVIMCCTSASSAWSRSAFAYAALFALPDVRVTQMTDITCPKAHVPTHVVDLRQLPRPRPPGHRLDPDVEHLRDLGWRKEFVSFGHGYPRSSARFGSDAAANAIGLDLCAARVGPAVNVLLGGLRRGTRVAGPVASTMSVFMYVQLPASLSVTHPSATPVKSTRATFIGACVSVCRAARIATSGFTGRR